jgi:predicted nucleic acid-binding protein
MVIADTGFFLALANRKDRHHGRAVSRLGDLAEPLVTTWPVVTETCHLLGTRLGAAAQTVFLNDLARGAAELFELGLAALPRLSELTAQYADLPMDLADASLVFLAEHLGHGRILSTDQRDFQTYRWKHHEPFENLLLRPA